MMKRKFCCDASKGMYMDYYRAQSGSGIPIFIGHRGQRGHGLGSILSGFFRTALPIVKKGLIHLGKSVGKQAGKQALSTGYDIVKDIAEGRNPKEAVKERAKEGINQFIPGAFPQSGSGKKRRRSHHPRGRYEKAKRGKRVKRDIFD